MPSIPLGLGKPLLRSVDLLYNSPPYPNLFHSSNSINLKISCFATLSSVDLLLFGILFRFDNLLQGILPSGSLSCNSIMLVGRANEDKPNLCVCVSLYLRVHRVHPLPRDFPSAITQIREDRATLEVCSSSYGTRALGFSRISPPHPPNFAQFFSEKYPKK